MDEISLADDSVLERLNRYNTHVTTCNQLCHLASACVFMCCTSSILVTVFMLQFIPTILKVLLKCIAFT